MLARVSRVIIIAALSAAPLGAQWSVRAIGGIVSSDWHFSDNNDFKQPLTGYAAGVSILHPFSTHLALQPEALLVRKGSSLDYPFGLVIDYRLTYLELPVLLRYTVRAGGALRPFFVAGPELGISVGCSTKAINSPANGSTVIYDPCTTGSAGISEDQPNPLDASVVVGVGVDFHRLSASVRYDQGLTDIYSRYPGGGTTHNTTWLFLIGVRP